MAATEKLCHMPEMSRITGKTKTTKGRTSWRDHGFHPGSEVPTGVINFSSGWFEQGHEVTVHLYFATVL